MADNLESTLTKLQNVSGVAFSSFLSLHLINHAAIHLGFEAADNLRFTSFSLSLRPRTPSHPHLHLFLS